MDIKSALATASKGLDFLEDAAPYAAHIVPIIGIIATVNEIMKNVRLRVNESKHVADSMDEADIRIITARIAKLNDELAGRIANS